METAVAGNFDVIVIGGGHAGIEAAYVAARMGSRTLMITMHLDTIGIMSCNPSIGGIGKGHIVQEIAAFGGLMPSICTKSYLQARMLNTRKGPAVQGLRLQIDKYAYNREIRKALENTPNLTLRMGMVEQLLIADGKMQGVRLRDEAVYHAPSVIITAGTFLNGTIYIGKPTHSAGRQGEEASTGLSQSLIDHGLAIGRLKTGTPPRILRSSIDFSELKAQEPNELGYLYEFYPHKVKNTLSCYVAHTNEKTHEIIRKNAYRSAIYNGNIQSTGPRYCPSIEDKVHRFADKTAHHVFVEPESIDSQEMYPNGLSSSLPYDVQEAFIRSMKGFENAHITRPAYAIEYDYVIPSQLKHSLEAKTINGLFLAGQINGTTGYEEAAGQGLIAGINAHLSHKGKNAFTLDRTESYIGILIDDIITLGVDEPYRMFTSRAEHRLTLRHDNAFFRLMPKAYELGLIDEQLYTDFISEKEIVMQTISAIKARKDKEKVFALFADINTNKTTLIEMFGEMSDRALMNIYAEILYEPYLIREKHDIDAVRAYRELQLSPATTYRNLPGLSRELQEKLERYNPETIAQASLIPGMTPAALSILIIKTKQKIKRGL